MTQADCTAAGLLDLSFAPDGARTTQLTRRRQRFPLHFTTPMWLDPALPGMAFIYIQNPSGAVFGGDRLDLRVAASEGSRVHLTTPSACKIHGTTSGPALQTVALEVGAGAALEYIPDPLIPQAGADYHQQTCLRLASGAVALVAEIVAPGRTARGEVFQFRRLRFDFRLAVDGRESFADVCDLDPGHAPPGLRGAFGTHRYLASFYALCPGQDSGRIALAMHSAVSRVAGTFAAATELPEQTGALARILADDSPQARDAVRRAWLAARQLLLGAPLPPTRK